MIATTVNVPAATLAQVGAGSVTTPPAGSPATPLTSGGKPEMLYIGAEYCPYCAFERWGMIVALSRFGSFSGLRTMHSSSTDVYPNTPTWTFYKSSYTSKYLTFTPVEETTNVPDGSGGYMPLQSPTAGPAGPAGEVRRSSLRLRRQQGRDSLRLFRQPVPDHRRERDHRLGASGRQELGHHRLRR